MRVDSASGRVMGLTATTGVSGCPSRTMSRNASRLAAKSDALWGVRVQQLVPWAMEITAASRSAISSALGSSPRADPA